MSQYQFLRTSRSSAYLAMHIPQKSSSPSLEPQTGISRYPDVLAVCIDFLRTMSAQETWFGLVTGILLFLVLLGLGSVWEGPDILLCMQDGIPHDNLLFCLTPRPAFVVF